MATNDQIQTTTDKATGAIRGATTVILSLRHGAIAGCNLRYELVGPLEGPVVVVAGGISAGRHVLSSNEISEAGWWQSQAKSFDVSRRRVLAFDWVNSDGTIIRAIDPADQAEALAQLLDHLAIAKIDRFVGASYGAMVGMHFAALFPERIGALLAFSAADRAHPYSSACRALQRKALSLGERFGDPAAGVALARAMAILTYRTPEEFAERFAEPPVVAANSLVRVSAESYLDHQGERYAAQRNSLAYRRLSESIDLHRIDPATVTVPLTLVAVDRDGLVPEGDIRSTAERAPNARFHRIESPYGHDAFLKEDDQVAALIIPFLDTLEHSR